jgi:tRNA-(ms[2]io[6]A)-hydroxylase
VIRSGTDPRWVEVALGDLDRVLVDHAHCEKKAAAQALSLVAAYPDRERLVRRLSALAIEELRHFRAVHRELRRRKLDLGRDRGDPYAKRLQGLVRSGGPGRLTDRLLVSGLIESRSHERLCLLADALPEAALADFYRALARAEEGHARLFVDLARRYDDHSAVDARLEELAGDEARIVASLPLEPRIH